MCTGDVSEREVGRVSVLWADVPLHQAVRTVRHQPDYCSPHAQAALHQRRQPAANTSQPHLQLHCRRRHHSRTVCHSARVYSILHCTVTAWYTVDKMQHRYISDHEWLWWLLWLLNSNSNSSSFLYCTLTRRPWAHHIVQMLWPPTLRPVHLGLWVHQKLELLSTSTISIDIITQPINWYSYHPWRVEIWVNLGTALKVAAHAQGCILQWPSDKHNCPQFDSNLGLLTLQSDVLTSRPLRPVIVGATTKKRMFSNLQPDSTVSQPVLL